MTYPKAKTTQLITQQLPEELLVHNEATGETHGLSLIAACVWQSADGTRSIEQLWNVAKKTLGVNVDRALIDEALENLTAAGLLEQPYKALQRRDILKTAAAAAVVTIFSVFSGNAQAGTSTASTSSPMTSSTSTAPMTSSTTTPSTTTSTTTSFTTSTTTMANMPQAPIM